MPGHRLALPLYSTKKRVMANLSMNIPHKLTKEEALGRIKSLLGKLSAEHAGTISDVKEDWVDNQGNFSFTAKGFDLAGTIQVNPSDVQIDAQLPFAVSLFSGAIKNIIRENADKLLA